MVDVIPFRQGVAAFALGDLFSYDLSTWDFVSVSVPQPNTLKCEPGPEKLKLSVGRTKGFINGTFTHPTTGLKTAIKSILLQEQGSALGYFLSSDASGTLPWFRAHRNDTPCRVHDQRAGQSQDATPSAGNLPGPCHGSACPSGWFL